ncbi:hypothetical protein KFE98_15870 [bacterium SCSIO 12741]|nr:hypothetical protein KFE98_15870 [bacterium SCSIO 12741]
MRCLPTPSSHYWGLYPYLLIGLILLSVACDKSDSAAKPDEDEYEDLYGEWRWVPHNAQNQFPDTVLPCIKGDSLEGEYWIAHWYDFELLPDQKLKVAERRAYVPKDVPFYKGTVDLMDPCTRIKLISTQRTEEQWWAFRSGFITLSLGGKTHEVQISNNRQFLRHNRDEYTRNSSYYLALKHCPTLPPQLSVVLSLF